MQYLAIFNQILWIITSVILIYWYAQKDENISKKFHDLASFLFSIHFIILWAHLWAAYNLAGTFRGFTKKSPLFIKIIILLLYLIIWIYFYGWLISITVILASLIWTYSYYFHEWFKFRTILTSTMILWIIYNIYYESLWWIITSCFFIIVNIYVMYQKK